MVIARCVFQEYVFATEDVEANTQLHIHGMTHNNQGGAEAINTKKPDRPGITADMSETDWAEFIH